MSSPAARAANALSAASLASSVPEVAVRELADSPPASPARAAAPAVTPAGGAKSPAADAFQPSRAVDGARAGRRTSVVGSRRTGKAAVTDFFYGTLLGEGAFARVLHAAHRDSGSEYAVKIVDKRQIARQNKRDSVMMERNVMGAARHHCVTRLVYTFQTRDELFFAMDLCRGRDLFAAIKRFRNGKEAGAGADGTLLPLPLCKFYMAQCVCALEYLHTRLGVVHLDFKPENVLLSERGHIKLADFGTAKAETLASRVSTAHRVAAEEVARSESRASSATPDDNDDESSSAGPPPAITHEHLTAASRHVSVVLAAALDRTAAERADQLSRDDRSSLQFVGTAEYVSPEMVSGEESHGSADLWALGCTLYQMATGRPPFTGPTEFSILQAGGEFAAGTAPLEWPEGVPGAVRGLTEALMRAEPSERLGARGLVGVGEPEGEEGGPEGEDGTGAAAAAPTARPGGSYAELKAHPFFEGVDWATVGTAAASAPWIPPARTLPPPASPSPLAWECLGEDADPAPAEPDPRAETAGGAGSLRIVQPGSAGRGPGSGRRGRSSVSPEGGSGTTPRHPLPAADPAPVPPTGGHGWVTGEALGAAQLTSIMDAAAPGAPLPASCWSGEYWAGLLPAGHEVLMFGRVGKKRGWLSRVMERDVVLAWSDAGDAAAAGAAAVAAGETDDVVDDVIVSPTRPTRGSVDRDHRRPTSPSALPSACLLYFDPSKRRQKGEIAWDDDLAVACSDRTRWSLTCSSGSYHMSDWAGRAELWARALRGAVSRRLEAMDREASRHRRPSDE